MKIIEDAARSAARRADIADEIAAIKLRLEALRATIEECESHEAALVNQALQMGALWLGNITEPLTPAQRGAWCTLLCDRLREEMRADDPLDVLEFYAEHYAEHITDAEIRAQIAMQAEKATP